MAANSNPYDPKKFTCEGHAEDVLKRVHSYKKENKYCDVTLIVTKDNDVIYKTGAHRLILSACSEYFAKMFTDDPNIVELAFEMEPDGLMALMEYCYAGEVMIRGKFVTDLMVAAAEYLMESLVQKCGDYLAEQLNSSNWFDIMSFAERNNFSNLITSAEAYVSQNIIEVSKSERFLELNLKNLENIIKITDIEVLHTVGVLERTLLWIQHDWLNRKDYVAPLIELLQLRLLPRSFVLENIKKIFGSNRERHSIFVKVLDRNRNNDECSEWKNFKILLIGGLSSVEGYPAQTRNIQCFNPELRQWIDWDTLPYVDFSFGADLIENKLIIVGGHPLELSSKAFMQDLETRKWTELNSIQTKRIWFSLVALNKFVYAIGGYDGDPLRTVERLDISNSNNTWEYVAPMLRNRASPAAAALEGKLYVTGGSKTSITNITNTFESYDPETDMWTELAPMITARRYSNAVAGNGYFYVFGGLGNTGYLNTVERYDPQENTWTQLSSFSVARAYITAVILGNRIFAIGGQTDSDTCSDLVEEYNTVTDQWTTQEPLTNGISKACAVAIPNIGSQLQ